MQSRVAALVLSGVLAFSFIGCSKKDNSQASQPAPAASQPAPADQSAASQPAGQSASAPAATTSQPASSQPAPAAAPVAQAPQPPPAPEPPPPPPPIVVPAGTSIVIRMGNSLTSKTDNVGDEFTGTLAHSVATGGAVAIPAGASVSGTVTNVKSPGRFKGEGVLSITLTSISVGGVPTGIHTSAYTQTVKGKGKRTAVMAGGGTGAGALIGGLAGGGKGALIGGLVGAGAGTAGAAFTGNKELEIPAESVVTFRLSSPITVHRHAKAAAAEQAQ
jgi:hypothetical protein